MKLLRRILSATFAPLVLRELREAARRPGVHRARLGVSAVGLFGLVGLVLTTNLPDQTRGPQLYLAVSLAALLYALVAGVLLTADSIPGERSRGTLGLLFLTDLRPPDILLGKLVANSIGGAYVLVGLLPILGVPLMFGGVTAFEVAGHSLLLLETLLLSLAIGLYASATQPGTGGAIATGLGLVFLLTFVPLLGFAFPMPLRMAAALSPLAQFIVIFLVGRPVPVQVDSALLTAGFVAIPAVAAMLFARAAARLSIDAPPPPVWARRIELFNTRSAVLGRPSPPPPPLLEYDPILWLLWRRNRFPRADGRLIAAVVVAGVLAAITAFSSEPGWIVVMLLVALLHFVTVSHMASQACQRIGTEDDRVALELLLTTPRAARGTFAAYHRAFCQLFQVQFRSLIVLYGILVVAGWMQAGDFRAPGWLIPVSALAALFSERQALSWVSLDLSLRHGRYHRALAGTLGRVLLPSWGAVLLIVVAGMTDQIRAEHWCYLWLLWLAVGALGLPALSSWHARKAERWLASHGDSGGAPQA
jgi:hypothetical protein